MIRDMELFRKVLIETEQVPPGQWQRIAVEGATPEEICYHVRLPFEANLIEARFMDDSAKDFVVRRLTYSGHEFLDAARSDTLWSVLTTWTPEAIRSQRNLAGSASRKKSSSLHLLGYRKEMDDGVYWRAHG